MPDKSSLVAIGQIVKPHGVHGEFKVTPLTDFIEERFTNLKEFYLFNDNDGAVKCSVVSVKLTPRYVIIGAKGFAIEDAERLRGRFIYIDKSEVFKLSEGVFYAFDLVGLRVVDAASGGEIGEVVGIYDGPGNDLIEVKLDSDSRVVLVPFVRQFIKKIDFTERKLHIEVMEGLI